MPTTKKYRLTWRKEQGGRWRKKYRGKSHYFPRREGETKAQSYLRCWREWQKKKAEIDQEEFANEPSHRFLLKRIALEKSRMVELQLEDTPQNRRDWIRAAARLDHYQWDFDNGVDPLLGGYDVDNQPEYIGSGNRTARSELDDPSPPWELAEQAIEPAETIAGNVQRFLQRKEAQAKRGERSIGRFESLRVGLESFVRSVGGDRPIAAAKTASLSRFRDELERLVDEGTLRPHTARDRLQAVKQFCRWAWAEELIDLPRIIQSRDFTIAIPEQRIETFTDAEIQRLLGAASEVTRLYLLLMLNCGMGQQDISDLFHSEVDWDAGRITRKRSKTRKNNGNNVPEVSYKLWAATFRLLTKYRSKHAELVLTNQKGGPLKVESIVNGRAKKIDNIRSAYRRLATKLKIGKPMKLLRKTAASKLGSHPEYSRFAQYFLGHAPGNVADRHYVVPSEEQFDVAMEWLGQQFLDKVK